MGRRLLCRLLPVALKSESIPMQNSCLQQEVRLPDGYEDFHRKDEPVVTVVKFQRPQGN